MARLAFAVVALSVWAIVGPAAAQSPGAPADSPPPGRTHASSYAPLPGDLPVTVRPWDNSAANLRLKANFTDAMSKRGVRLAETGTPLLLNFETEIENLGGTEYNPTLGQVQGRNHDTRVRLNFWSSTQDSVMTGRRDGGVPNLGSVRYVLRATLDDQRSGQRLWQGEASYTAAPSDETTTFALMVPVLVDNLGQNVRPRAFRID
jgi:hypothetical protein